MAPSDRSGKLSHSRASSRPSSSSRQDTAPSGPAEALGTNTYAQARHQLSFSEFYAYVQSDCSLLGSANGSHVEAVGVPGSEASYSDYQVPEARRGQGESRSDAGLSYAEKPHPSGRGPHEKSEMPAPHCEFWDKYS
ncbi:hypothetical protein CT0861_13066 [Colletotrichum tofieldiae]|uniref:Uncharacterized protein n=1 Tax=Colletotrichum tofieldiae TaxID=708197 RepID=A0A166NHH5_9PEZI|nr:hypothetical protein CT0861_13066 [Colletotrichum tofieldiae]